MPPLVQTVFVIVYGHDEIICPKDCIERQYSQGQRAIDQRIVELIRDPLKMVMQNLPKQKM